MAKTKIVFINTYHKEWAEAALLAEKVGQNYEISDRAIMRVKRKLCGGDDCPCSKELFGEYGSTFIGWFVKEVKDITRYDVIKVAKTSKDSWIIRF